MTTKGSKKHTQKEHCIDSSVTSRTWMTKRQNRRHIWSVILFLHIWLGYGGHPKIFPNRTKLVKHLQWSAVCRINTLLWNTKLSPSEEKELHECQTERESKARDVLCWAGHCLLSNNPALFCFSTAPIDDTQGPKGGQPSRCRVEQPQRG